MKKQGTQLLFIIVIVFLVGLVLGQMFEVRVGPGKAIQGLRRLLTRSDLVNKQQGRTTLPSFDELARVVTPQEGKVVKVQWGDMGKKLVAAGAIDRDKLAKNFPTLASEEQRALEGDDLEEIRFT